MEAAERQFRAQDLDKKLVDLENAKQRQVICYRSTISDKSTVGLKSRLGQRNLSVRRRYSSKIKLARGSVFAFARGGGVNFSDAIGETNAGEWRDVAFLKISQSRSRTFDYNH